jgi:putative ATPase
MSDRVSPLAARMRPRTLDEFVGQEAIIGPGRLLRRAIQADQLSSVIFAGPPGTGKTTLAQIIANHTRAKFIAINAVLAGVKEIRSAVDSAQSLRNQQQQRTILFVDEVHRFNKAQQDALLPWVENGTITLIGATTENPYFEVNKALVSRSRIFQLKPLEAADLRNVVQMALNDSERGYGDRPISLAPEALAHLVNVANGDARTLLNALELAVETTEANATGVIQIDLAIAEASIQQRAVLYDKEGDAHFDIISAFIKSLRGSDPDAALYWLAKMVYAGEDPRFILRRMLIFASEDIGLAAPEAVAIVNACAQSFDRVGLPEGQYPLAQAALYLATAPKSNSVMGYFDALAAIQREREAEVPNHLKDKNRDHHGFGHGAGYRYPHAYQDHWVAQQYLPTALQGQVFYQPTQQGAEATIGDRLSRQREAQLAAILSTDTTPGEILTRSPSSPSQERWLQRTINQTGQHLAQIRSRLFELATIERHHLVLDLHAQGGLLLWEALRHTPEGGVYGRVANVQNTEPLDQQAQNLPNLRRPEWIITPLLSTDQALATHTPNLQLDWIIGRNLLLLPEPGLTPTAIAQLLLRLLPKQGRAVLCETIPATGQRLYELVKSGAMTGRSETITPKLYQAWQEAEEAFYLPGQGDPRLAWTPDTLVESWETLGLKVVPHAEEQHLQWQVTPALLDRWFQPGQEIPSYGDRLRTQLNPAEVKQIRDCMAEQLLNHTIDWRTHLVYLAISVA